MVKRYQIMDNKVVEAEEGQQGQIIRYINPDEAEKKHLLEDYTLDEHTLNSTLDPDRRS